MSTLTKVEFVALIFLARITYFEFTTQDCRTHTYIHYHLICLYNITHFQLIFLVLLSTRYRILGTYFDDKYNLTIKTIILYNNLDHSHTRSCLAIFVMFARYSSHFSSYIHSILFPPLFSLF